MVLKKIHLAQRHAGRRTARKYKKAGRYKKIGRIYMPYLIGSIGYIDNARITVLSKFQ